MVLLKRLLLICFFVVVGHSEGYAQLSRYQPMKPEKKIDFTVTDTEGNSRQISEFRGRIVMINFWASWCPPCVRELPSLKNLAETFPQEEFIILAVSKDQKDKQNVAKKLFPESTLSIMPLFFDDNNEGSELLEVKGLPTTVVLDRKGRLIGRLSGATIWDHHEVQDLVQNYIDGRTPQPLSWWARLKQIFSFSKSK